VKNILIIQPIDKSGIEILENRPDYNFEILSNFIYNILKKNKLYLLE